MEKAVYHLVDVFTNRAFGGNQLAVFPDARDIPSELMQKIARELNLSETSFVLPPEGADSDFRLRIFTPAIELPMAGHPTVGTAFVLSRLGLIDPSGGARSVRFQEGVGIIRVGLEFPEGAPAIITMEQPLPIFSDPPLDRRRVASLLSIDEAGLDPGLPVEVVSCGVAFLYVPIKNLKTVRALKLRADLWEETLRDSEAPHVFAFTREVERHGSTVHSRMFAPAMGIAEDPATGAASGPLGCYLVKHGIAAAGESIISEQGMEMGRPSFIRIEISLEADKGFSGVRVGGECVYMGEGFLNL
ncbi:MAG TPA: PhzF family phenazine biosynthesis protein [Blastocatellia bacterium]|nr:PhzF family phenazine biosynthesis protein [Blastocatellia bacterium]